MNSLIAAKLNVLETAIVRIEEWTHVLFVVVKGLGARFVSKKVVEVKVEHENNGNLVVKRCPNCSYIFIKYEIKKSFL